MRVIYVGFLLLVLTNAEKWNISCSQNEYEIHKGNMITVPFTVDIISLNNKTIPNIIATTSNAKIAIVSAPPSLNPLTGNATYWNNSVNITGLFLGTAEILLTIENDSASEKLIITVIRPARLIDKLFTISVATLVSILYINFGCAIDWKVCRETIKNPIGPLVGSFCQFIIMPLIAFGIGHVLFPNNPEMQIGLFFTGISPSGGASNIWTVLLGGNLPLSISMTTLSTVASFGTIPLWIFTLGKFIFNKGNLNVPYQNIATLAIALIIPLGIGCIIQHKFPKISRIMVRIMKPFSIILILFIVVFAIVSNFYLFELFSWRIIIAGSGLPWLGFIFGFVIMTVCRRPQGDIRAIAIETGIQNTGIAIFLLRFSLKQPAADLTTIIPVSCAIMTPVPLMILWLIKLIFDRRKKESATSMEKLQLDANKVVVSPSNVSTIVA